MSASATTPAFTQKTILQHKPFRILWMAQFVSIFGDFLALFGVISLITFKLHGTAVQVTSVTIAYVLPLAVLSPVAGVFVDHWNVKRVMIISDVVRAVLILMLLFVTDVRQICAIFFAISAVSSFFSPAQSVTLRVLVPAEGLLAANGLMTNAFFVVRLASPLVAGSVISTLGEKACFYLDTASFAFSAIMISTLAIVRPARADGEKTLASLTRDFLDGNKFIFTHAGLSFVFLAMAVATFVLSSFSPLISIFIRDMLHAGPFTFGVCSSMVGIGLIMGGMVLPRVSRTVSRVNVVLSGLFVLGAGAALLGGFSNIPMAAASMFLVGFAIAFVLIPAQTMSQQETPPTMVARVSGSFMSLMWIGQVMGLLISGFLAQKLGIRPLFLASAGAMALVTAAGYFMMRGRSHLAQTATERASAALD
ncbi:MAG: MFS transporter [Acidobacteriia bacterium]|nr:MFS transporter [Terriglobia bacterium]